MDYHLNEPEAKQVKREERKFDKIIERVEKALCLLNETVDVVNISFRPVIGEPGPQECQECKETAGIMGESAFENFMYSTESRILDAVEKIRELCQRSTI